MKEFFVYETVLGPIHIAEEDGVITRLDFYTDTDKEALNREEMQETPLLRQAYAQLEEYLAGERRTFALPLAPKGTPFQKRVWQALLEIPYGQTTSYGEIAKKAGSPKGARAVGMANNKNPIAIIIPCHRVIGKNGALVGYGGGLDKKQVLLKIEGIQGQD